MNVLDGLEYIILWESIIDNCKSNIKEYDCISEKVDSSD